MISSRVKTYIQQQPDVLRALDQEPGRADWSNYPRSAFDLIARVINDRVTQRVLEQPQLVSDLIVIGSNELESTYFKHRLKTMEDFLAYLKSHTPFRPFNWVSGKSLHSYWHGGTPKEKKYNVLLSFVEPDISKWPEWKSDIERPRHDHGASLLRRHFLGHYMRYYRKTDGSEVLIRAPFLVYEDLNGGICVETKTMGHEYRSSYAAIREGAWYIDCENLTWNERESHIYNIGFESNPQIIMGVSNTLDKRKNAMAVLNILVKQRDAYNYQESTAEEIPFGQISDKSKIDFSIMQYLSRKSCTSLVSQFIHSGEELLRTIESSSFVQ